MSVFIGLFTDLLEQVGVESATKTFVSADHQHQGFSTLTLLEQRMSIAIDVLLEVRQNLVELVRVVTTCECLVLRFLHFSGSNKLHRLSDLRGAFDRLNTSADVAKVGHVFGGRVSGIGCQGNQLC